MPIPKLERGNLKRFQHRAGNEHNIVVQQTAGINHVVRRALAELHHNAVIGAQTESQFSFRWLKPEFIEATLNVVRNEADDGFIDKFPQDGIHLGAIRPRRCWLTEMKSAISKLQRKSAALRANFETVPTHALQTEKQGIAPLIGTLR